MRRLEIALAAAVLATACSEPPPAPEAPAPTAAPSATDAQTPAPAPQPEPVVVPLPAAEPAAAPAPAPAPAAAPAVPGKGWWVVATSDTDEAAARATAEELRKKGYAVEVHSAEIKGVFWHRAVITGLKTREEAKALTATLEKDLKIKGAWITRASAAPP